MKKIFSYIIIFILLIGVGLVDVRAQKIMCICNNEEGSEYRFNILFYVSDKSPNDSPQFSANINGETLGENGLFGLKPFTNYRLQNYNDFYGNNNTYTYLDEYKNTGKCPSYVIYTRNYAALNDWQESHHFSAADESSKDAIIEYANANNLTSEWSLLGGTVYKTATSYVGTCTTRIVEEDPVVSNSNEPSNEPVDPNSNIPEFNSQQTLRNNDVVYSCGENTMENIPSDIPRITRFLYIFLQILVPIGLVLVSSIDLFKAIAAQKEDDIKKGQQTLIKRIITAVIVFFVFAIVKLVISVISDNSEGVIDCVSCFLENSDEYCKTM